jgi:DNA-binding transcriptional ArsR family regulator/uncharacterized protein YndB with AHSA1/START domain
VSTAPPDADDVFRALADPSRRQLLDSLRGEDGQTLRDLCSGLAMARQSVSKHLSVLEAAGLVTTLRSGREKLHYLNAAPISELAERWIAPYHRDRVEALADLKSALEETTMSKPDFVYTSYIRTTAERLFAALTEPAFTERYWNLTFDTDWRPGSRMVWHNQGVTIDDPDQVVLECDPPRRLAYTWHTFVPELGERLGMEPERVRAMGAEPRSRVAFELEPVGDQVRLTVIHEGFPPDSEFLRSVTRGWPIVVSALKSMLEVDARVLV